jgi:hypothetical protein
MAGEWHGISMVCVNLPSGCNKETIIQILSVFLQLPSWLYIGMFCKRMIFCVGAGDNNV